MTVSLSVLIRVLYQVPCSLEAATTVKAVASVGTPSRRRLTGQGGRVAKMYKTKKGAKKMGVTEARGKMMAMLWVSPPADSEDRRKKICIKDR